MKYKILIKRCDDPQRASAIAAEVARWSGSPPDVVYSAITQKAICIRKEADEDEAQRLRAQFGGIGAEVDLVPVQDAAPVAAAFAAAPAGVTAAAAFGAAPPTSTAAGHDGDYDDEDDEPGRILTDAEYADMAKGRPDVFYFEKAAKMRNIQSICFIMAVLLCVYMSTRTVVEVATDFFEKLPEDRKVTVVDGKEIQAQLEKQKEEEKKKEEIKTDKASLKPTKSSGVSSNTGGGDPRARVTQMGVLGIVSGQIKGKSVASADIFGKGGFATDIDAILSGVGGLKSGGDGGVGRKGVAGIGYGSGYGSGFGGPGGGIDDLLGGLLGGGSGGVDLKMRTGKLRETSATIGTASSLTGGRSRASIQRVVMQNMAALRHAYSRRLRDKPGLSGTITVKFSIDEFGRVIYAEMVSSTMSDSELETTVVARVRSWVFEKIDKPGDVTEVTYPFAFAQ
ncbi:MAG: TonB family protein [Chitinispirillia bacterium]|nr:TonB family protein [Chitinispirillia bacterium]MCL2267740.1 TonB family protein [Chitinispirillia bacterium]